MQSSVEGAAAMRRLSGYARSTLLQKAAQALQSRQEEFAAEAAASIDQQARIEASDTLAFDEYLARYFSA